MQTNWLGSVNVFNPIAITVDIIVKERESLYQLDNSIKFLKWSISDFRCNKLKYPEQYHKEINDLYKYLRLCIDTFSTNHFPSILRPVVQDIKEFTEELSHYCNP